MDKDLVKQGYNKAAEDYNEKRDRFGNNKYLGQLNSLLKPNSQILDIGCGAGVPIDEFFVKHGHKVLGIDISEKMIELAKRNVPEGEYKIEDMSQFRPGEYQVDAVVSFYAIFHTPRKTHSELLNTINSFLPPSGYILITMGSSEWEGKEQDFHGAEMFWSHYDSKKNRELVENAGFEALLDEIDQTGDEKHQVILARKK